jgi:hypothetical protein
MVAWANLSEAQLQGIQFGEWTFLEEDGAVEACTYSLYGQLLTVGLCNGTVSLYKVASMQKTRPYPAIPTGF